MPPPPIPSHRVVVYDCLSRDTHELQHKPLSFGNTPDSDIRIGTSAFGKGKIILSRVQKRLSFSLEGAELLLEVDGRAFEGGLLPEKKEGVWSLSVDRGAFFFIKIGEDALDWGRKLKGSPPNCWRLHLFAGGVDSFNEWIETQPETFPGLRTLPHQELRQIFAETGKMLSGAELGVMYHEGFSSPGFFLSQFVSLAGENGLTDEGDLRCHRCWMRFTAGRVLAIDPSDYGDEILGESELKRFTPSAIDSDGRPVTPDGRPCARLACPHCRGELPPNFLEKPPHLISIVGDSMAGKSYFLAAVVKQLLGRMKRNLNVSFTDGDPIGNDAVSKMVARLFSPSEKPEDTFLEKTELAGATYKIYLRRGKLVSLPAPFTYNLYARCRGASTIVFYDNAGEHFRPGKSETDKSNFTEHIAWAGGLVFLFDPLQHSGLLRKLKPGSDPQVARMKRNASTLRFDQHVILSEMAGRLRTWRGSAFGEDSDVPFAVVLGKHDLLGEAFPVSDLRMDLCRDGAVCQEAITANSNLTHSFLLEHCPDIVAAAEEVSGKVKYFPASSFGSPAVELSNVRDDGGDAMIGPDPLRLEPYLVEAPFLWLFSELEPVLVPSSEIRPA